MLLHPIQVKDIEKFCFAYFKHVDNYYRVFLDDSSLLQRETVPLRCNALRGKAKSPYILLKQDSTLFVPAEQKEISPDCNQLDLFQQPLSITAAKCTQETRISSFENA